LRDATGRRRTARAASPAPGDGRGRRPDRRPDDPVRAGRRAEGVPRARRRRHRPREAGRTRRARITAEQSPIAKTRGAKLGVDSVILGARRKGESVEALLAEHGLPAEAVAYVGDDLLDLPALQRAGLAVAVADAVAEVRAAAHVVTRARGGHGAIREAVELILRAQGSWTSTVEAYAQDHGALPARR